MFRRLPKDDVFMTTTLGSFLFGNAIDRIHQTTVTDFSILYPPPPKNGWLAVYGGISIFNVADSALVVGVGTFLFTTYFEEKEVPNQQRISLFVAHTVPVYGPHTPGVCRCGSVPTGHCTLSPQLRPKRRRHILETCSFMVPS